ncbi:HAD family hydrolase [Paenibacillus validus]|uniref:HAD family hydrolase n=1 Tax=Paenibacillus validus TaxID=44253 RepID=UPI000FDCD695|nr:HAD family hydrolase [Paenibacillus validus]
MIRAVVFDFDGLIVDTETADFESVQAMYRHHGGELTIDVWGHCIGTGPDAFNPYDDLERQIGRTYDREAARAMRKQAYDARMAEADVRPGVRSYLKEARRLGLRIGLASSSTREWVTGYLKAYGLLDDFECIRTRDDVTRVKPDPELYLKALAALGVQPHEAVAFEDSPNGALAAYRAGMRCVVVPNAVTGLLTFGTHDFRLASVEEIGLAAVIKRLQQTDILKNRGRDIQ